MPVARFQMPDGRVARFEVPDGTTPEQATEMMQAHFGGAEAPPAKESGGIGQQIGNLAAGAVRGAGSIGATLLAPVDAAARAMGVQNSVIGRTDRRAAMDSALSGMGADTDSLAYQGGKIGTEIAGTMGAGGAAANVLGRVPGIAAKVPNLLQAVRTAGMSGGNALTRAAGGAVTGGAAAGLIDPESAGTGALIGGALPVVLQGAGKVGRSIGAVVRGPAATPEATAAINAARKAGYVIPPTQAKPSLANRVLEGFSGKITTAQNASAKNQAVTAKLAAEAIGLPADTKLSPDVLKTVRDQAGQAYDAIGKSGAITPGAAYGKALDKIAEPHLTAAAGFPDAKASPVIELVDSLRSKSFDSSAAIAKIKELRSAADDAFRTGNTDIARASKSAAKAMEDAVEEHLSTTGNTAMLADFKAARELIAKTYSVEKAMNPATGTVDARKLAAQLAKGKPLSGGLKSAAEFASRFPKAAQSIEGMGSLPQTSPLDWAAAGTLSAATSNPLMMAGVIARPAARKAVLSGVVQNNLTRPAGANAISRVLTNDKTKQAILRAAPVVGSQSGR